MMPDQAIEQSVNDINPETYGGARASFFVYEGEVFDWLAPWGTPKREAQLYALFYALYNTMMVGALTNLIRRVKQVPNEIDGGRNMARRYRGILQQAQYGAGWDYFLAAFLRDFLSQDNGAWMEIIGPGAPDTPLRTAATGIAALDSRRCVATGNPEYPAYYWSHRTRKLHKVHWTRVYRMVDMPSTDPNMMGLGLCAMSRGVGVARINSQMLQYRAESLDDLPMDGIYTLGNVHPQQFEDVRAQLEARRKVKGQKIYRSGMYLHSPDPGETPVVNFTSMRRPADGMTEGTRESLQMDAILLANAINDDPSEIMPITAAGLSGGLQATYQHVKGKSRIFGDILTELARMINIALLPAELEFKWKSRDTQQSSEEAAIAKAWAESGQIVLNSGGFSQMEYRQFLANTVPAYADVLLDEAGTVRLPDDDVKPEGEENVSVQDDDSAPTDAAAKSSDIQIELKDIQSTRSDFENDLEDLLADAIAGQVTRRRFGVVLRGMIARYGRRAYRDGLRYGGVNPDDITDEDLATIERMITEQSVYVTGLGEAIFINETVTPAMAAGKPEMWWNKSLAPFYDAGIMSADRNGYYRWDLGRTEKHCSDCKTLDGQIHRYRDYVRLGWMPRSAKLKCKGFKCDCDLNKVEDAGARASGKFPKSSKIHHHYQEAA